MKPSAAVTAIALVVLLSGTVQAQVASPKADPLTALSEAPDPTTVEPLPLPEVDDDLSTPEALQQLEPQPERPGPGSPSQPPEPDANPSTPELEDWLSQPAEPQPEAAPDLVPQAAALANGWQFTTSRVFPKGELLSFPYTAIGRITFQDAVGNFHACTGSVIQLRLVLTAGHCVYDQAHHQWYKNWSFYPQYYDGPSPLGAWAVSRAFTTRQWITGTLPNPGDFGILVTVDQTQAVGQVTGWLGWQTGVFQEHFHQFGYPGNLDQGQRPQVTTAQVAGVLVDHYRWGTNQTFGSSGGPLIMNFGENGLGQDFSNNTVIGVVSFGNPATGFAASSKMQANFTALVRAACNVEAGNCGAPPPAATVAAR